MAGHEFYKAHGKDWDIKKAFLNGGHQSPINLQQGPNGAAHLGVRYGAAKVGHLINNELTWEVHYHGDYGGTLFFGGRMFTLVQFHFHAPSEHTVEGIDFSPNYPKGHYSMEVHLVHSDIRPWDKEIEKTGKHLAVIAVMFIEGTDNPFLAKFWKDMPRHQEEKPSANLSLDAEELLPKNRAYQTYTGSLTTPPCSDQVTWIVLNEPIEASKNQIDQLRKNMQDLAGADNYRAVQTNKPCVQYSPRGGASVFGE